MTKPTEPVRTSGTGTTTRAPAAPKTRKRSPWKKELACFLLPPVQTLNENGKWFSRVPLSGRYGAGRWMTLDADAWEAVRQRFGKDWYLSPSKYWKGKAISFRVRTGRRDPNERCISAHFPSGVITLSRWLVNATKPQQQVTYRDGDCLNLRRSNLAIRVIPATRIKPAAALTTSLTTTPRRHLPAQHHDRKEPPHERLDQP